MTASGYNNTTSTPDAPAANGYSPHVNGYSNGHTQPMDGRQGEYAQSDLSSPNPQSSQQHHHPDGLPPDQASGAQYSSQGQEVKYNPSATPTSDYGVNTPSSRSSQFPQYQDHRYQSNGAPQPNHHTDQPSNPAMSASSPTYPQHHYAPYGSHPDMPPYQPPPSMYPRPGDYTPAGYAHPHAMSPHYGHVAGAPMMGRGPPGGGHPLSTVYSFVPIPGTHQQKRPRRRYEEIERMYKCGWNGCEKAYGTLNHLNAHVTMQAHGIKRTPEEFKEIRKEWKQKKKDEDGMRKAEEERHRQQGGYQPPHQVDGPNGSEQASGGYPQGVQRQLPPLGYAPAGGQVPPQYGQPPAGVDGMSHQYSGPPVQGYYPPQSPYGPQNPQM